MVSTPEPPDPKETAQAQAGYNQDTATQQSLLNQTDQITNDGSLKYTQSGVNTYVNADGKTVTVPKFTATQSLSASNQGIYDTNQATKQNIATIGKDQSAAIGNLLSKPLQLGNEATEARLYELGSKRLDPQFAQQDDALRTRLINSGVREGSAAYDAAYNNFGQQKNDAYNQLLLTGRAQANQELTAERNAPINEISALMSGSQVAQPNFVSTPQSQVAGVDYTGLVNDKYKAQVASSNATMGGLFGLAGAGVSLFSDRRLKDDIRRVGTLDNGLPVYAYRYKAGGPVQLGLMADEVAGVVPEAVSIHESGFAMVNYGLATEAA